MISRGYKEVEKYPDFLRHYKAQDVKFIFGKENGFYSLICEGYISGKYDNSNPANIIGCFVKLLRDIPQTVSSSLEKKITEMTEPSAILFVAMDALQQQREEMREFLKILHKKI